MATWFRRLLYMLRQSQHDSDLREEIETHRAMRAADLERQGMTPEEALAASRRALGNALLAREDVRNLWSGSWATVWQDVRYGARACRRNPGFTAAAVVTLALGIGVNTGIFTVVNALLLRPLTAPRAHELVSISQTVTGIPEMTGMSTFSTADYVAYRDRTRTLSGLAAFGNARGEATLGGDAPRKILGALVSCNFFSVLQQPPALGRGFLPGDCEQGAELVVVLTRELWRTTFGSDPQIVGRTVQLNRQRATVVGVATAGTFTGSLVGGGYLAPLPAGRLLSSGDSRYGDDRMAWLTLVGRRNDSVAIEQVRAELAVVAAQIDRQRPGRSTVLAVDRARSTDGLSRELRGLSAGVAAVLMAAFGLVLLIACANVANLLLARGASRAPEIGVRMSLGASRGRVVRQLVTESLLLSVMGGVLGSLAAVWSFESLVGMAVPALLPPWFPLTISLDLSPDVRVLAFAIALTVVTGVLFGLAPALHASRPDLHAVMRQDTTGAGRSAGGRRLRATLVGVQVALCMVLMIAAGLLLRGLHATYTVDPGFSYRDVALVSLESAFDGYSEAEAAAKQRSLLAAVRAVPGVTAVGGADHKPLGDDQSPRLIRLPNEGENVARVGEATTVSHDYFTALGLRIIRGRAFTDQDELRRAAGPRPVILTAATAGNLWPGSDPIGRTLVAVPPGFPEGLETLEVIGIAADAQVSAIGRVDPYHLYLAGPVGGVLLVKGRGDVAATVAGIRAAARAVDPALILTIMPLEASLGWSRGIAGTVTTLFRALGVLALILAGVGVYGVVAFAVSGRLTEIGIRLALGASVPGVLTMLLRDTLRPVVIGAAVGLAGAAALSRVLSSVLFGISPADPLALGGAALLVLGVALVAALIGARPANRTEAIAALRAQ